MNPNDWYSWLLCIGVVVINLALVFVAWWALFADRAQMKDRLRRRCPHCWYDMAYSPGMTCGECGFTARNEAQFGKTRRRYGLAALAILASVGIVLYVNLQTTQRGLPSLLPSRLLIWLLPLASEQNSSILNEINNRASADRLSDSQWQALVGRCCSGDWRAGPTSDSWIMKYGSFIASWRQQFVNDAEIEKRLTAIPPRIDLTTREVWPTDASVVIGVQVRDWWPWGTECRIRATPRVPGLSVQPTVFGRSGDDRFPRSPYPLYLPPMDASVREVLIDFQIDRRRPRFVFRSVNQVQPDENDEHVEWQPAYTQTLRVPVKIEGSIQQAAQPTDSEPMRQAMMQVFGLGAVKWSAGSSPVRFNVDFAQTFRDAFDDTAVGLVVELQHDGRVARRLSLWWMGGTGPGSRADRHYGFEVNFEDSALLQSLAPEDPSWSLHLRGDPQLALRAGKAGKYWNGSVTLPLQLRTIQDSAPARPWWTQENAVDN